MKTKPRRPDQVLLVASNSAEFAFTTTRIAVSQICKSVGFEKSQFSTLNILTDVAIKYLQLIAKSAASSANASDRTQSNIFDLVNALDDTNSLLGFNGASSLHRSKTSLVMSGVLSDLICFVKYRHEIPFARPLPKRDASDSPLPFMHHSHSASVPSIPQGFHIPRWLPPFPKVAKFEESHGALHERRDNDEQLWGNIVPVENGAADQQISVNEGGILGEHGEPNGRLNCNIVQVKKVADLTGVEVGVRKVIFCGEKRIYCSISSSSEGSMEREEGHIKRRNTLSRLK